MNKKYYKVIFIWLLGMNLASLSGLSMHWSNIFENRCNKHIVLIGNPGAGKSAILNGIVGKNIFKSGLGDGSGLTKAVQIFETRTQSCNFIYIDTPGLADVEFEEQATREIEKALSFDGYYSIFFVFKLQDGRIIKEDCSTINRVMASINTPDKKYNIIINKITKRERLEILDDPENHYKFTSLLLKNLDLPYSSHTFVDMDLNILDDTSDFLSLKADIVRFIAEEAPSFKLSRFRVGRILTPEEKLKEVEKKQRELERKLEQQTAQEAAIRREIRQVQRQCEEEDDPCVLF